jgi:hypothetical protein
VQFLVQQLNWPEARAFCRTLGGDLFTLENDADYDILKPSADGSWIGLNSIVDHDNPRVYTWSDGSAMTFVPWDVQSHNSNQSAMTDINCGSLTTKVLYCCIESSLVLKIKCYEMRHESYSDMYTRDKLIQRMIRTELTMG